jgi:hypothetical protein
LDQSLQRPGFGAQCAIDRRDDSGDRGVAIEIERIADRHLVAVERRWKRRTSPGSDRWHRRAAAKSLAGSAATTAALQFAFAVQPDVNRLGITDDVRVRDDLSVGGHDQPVPMLSPPSP